MLNGTVTKEENKYAGDHEKKGHLSGDDLSMHGHGTDRRSNTEDERDIANIGSNNIAESHISLGRIEKICLQADEELRGTRAKRDNGKPHHQWRNSHHERDFPGSLDQPFSAKIEKG